MTSADSITYLSVATHHNVSLHRGLISHRCLTVLERRDFPNPGIYAQIMAVNIASML